MPRFFVKKDVRKNVVVAKKELKQKIPEKGTKRKVKGDVEISSDEELMYDEDSRGVMEVEHDEYEDVQAVAFRKAKQLLADIQEKNDDGEFLDDEAVNDRLKSDYLSKLPGQQKVVADIVRISDEVVQYRAHRYSTVAVAISQSGRYVVSCTKDATVVKYDLEEGKKQVRNHKKGDEESHKGNINCIAISGNDRYIVTGGADSVVRVWNFDDLQHVKNFTGHRKAVTGLAFRLNTLQLYSCSSDRSVKLWDLELLGYVETLFGHEDAITTIDALSRERLITAGGQDRTLRLWKVPEETHLIFNGYESCISIDCVAMINEDHFLSGSADGSINIWSIYKKKPTYTQREAHGLQESGQPNWIVSVAVRHYTDVAASGSCDGYVRIWRIAQDYKSMTNVISFKQVGFINCLRFAEDGHEVVCAVGQEHKLGRWWKIGEAKNCVTVFSLVYSDDLQNSE